MIQIVTLNWEELSTILRIPFVFFLLSQLWTFLRVRAWEHAIQTGLQTAAQALLSTVLFSIVMAVFGPSRWNSIVHNFHLLNCRMKVKPATSSISFSFIVIILDFIWWYQKFAIISSSKSIVNNNLSPSAAGHWLSWVRSICCHTVCAFEGWSRGKKGDGDTATRIPQSFVAFPRMSGGQFGELIPTKSLLSSRAAQWMRTMYRLWTFSVPVLFALGKRLTGVCVCARVCGREHEKNCRRNDVTINRSSRLACSSFASCFWPTTRLSIILSIGFAFFSVVGAFVDLRRHTNLVPTTYGSCVFGFRILDFRHDGGDSSVDPNE